jgi:hypothetical protein
MLWQAGARLVVRFEFRGLDLSFAGWKCRKAALCHDLLRSMTKMAARIGCAAAGFVLNLALSIGAAGQLAAADGDNDFYNGKQIRLIVSTDAGGAYDTYARLLAQVLREHIPGNPTIIVQNMPGAAGLKAANYIYNSAPRDGTVIAGTHSSVPTGPLTSPGAALYDVNRLSWIGSITSDPYIGYVWHTAPINSLEDAKSIEVVMGGMSVGTAGTDLSILAKEMFGLKFKIVTGYKASTDVKLAMEKGEVQGTFANAWSSVKAADPEFLTEKKIRIIVQHGSTDVPICPTSRRFSTSRRPSLTVRRSPSCWPGKKPLSLILHHPTFLLNASRSCGGRSMKPSMIQNS